MNKYIVIEYRLTRKVTPSAVLEVLESLFNTQSLFYAECLFEINVGLYEFEYEGKRHTNKKRNSVNTLLKRYPELANFYRCTPTENSFTEATASISNISPDVFSCSGDIAYSVIRDIVAKVPRPYTADELSLIFNGIRFDSNDAPGTKIHPATDGGAAVGNFIEYFRTSYGNEKHSYVIFAADADKFDLLRPLFFAFAEKVPGKYMGASYHE